MIIPCLHILLININSVVKAEKSTYYIKCNVDLFNCPKCMFYFSGSYSLHSMDANGHVVYKHETNLVSFYLHYTVDTEYNWSGWQFTRDIHDIFGFISNDNDDTCPHGAKKSPWR